MSRMKTDDVQSLPKKLLPFIWHFAKRFKFVLFLMLASGVFHAVVNNFIPYMLRIIVDTINAHDGSVSLYSAIKQPVSLYILGWIVMFLNWIFAYNILYMKCILKIQNNISSGVFRYLQNHSYAFFQDNLSGAISNKVTLISYNARLIMERINLDLFPVFMNILFSVIILSTVSYYFSLVALLWSVAYLIVMTYFSRKISVHSKKWSKESSKLNGKIVDSIGNILSVKSFANTKHEHKIINKQLREILKRARTTLIFRRKIAFLKNSLLVVFLLMNLLFLLRMHSKMLLSVGDFIFVLNITVHLLWTVRWTSRNISDLLETIGVCKNGLSLVMKPLGIVNKPNAKPISVQSGKIEFKNVLFKYRKSKNIFENLNLIIEPKTKVGLVGFSGAGKSTFVKLLMRYYDLKKGRILIDEQNIRNCTQNSLRSSIAFIPQDSMLFHRTILENIKYGNLKAAKKEVVKAAKKANCHEFIQDLPKKYNTVVGERGIKLSGGQKQRIAIARAILKNAPILILDEATSSLDSHTERHIQDSMKELMKDRTVIAIAHRLSTLRNMDRILVFEDGKIIEDGSHRELMRKKGNYYNLWNMQSDGFLPESVDSGQCTVDSEVIKSP